MNKFICHCLGLAACLALLVACDDKKEPGKPITGQPSSLVAGSR
jgi:hypothetical protein